MIEPIAIHDDEDLMIRWLPGNGARLILAFSGVQHGMGGLPMDEFIGTASDGAQNHVLFISDMKRSWYSRRGLVDRIVTCVEGFMHQHGITTVDALGNSMGGYGAIRFGSELPIRNVAAFAPQVAMDLTIIDEPRWMRFRGSFGDDLLPSLEGPIRNSNAKIYIVFGRDAKLDMLHAQLLPDVPHLKVDCLPHCWHDVIKHLKSTGYAPSLVQAMLSGDDDAIAAILASFKQYQEQWPRVLSRCATSLKNRILKVH